MKIMDKTSFLFVVLISIVFFYEGLRRIAKFVFMFSDWLSSRNWLITSGRIIESSSRSIEIPRYKRGSRMLPNGIRFLPNICYEYHVNAETFQSKKIYLAQGSLISGFMSADALVEKYPLDKNVSVYYHPENPRRSYLEKKDYRVIVRNLIVGLFWLLVGFVFLMQELNK